MVFITETLFTSSIMCTSQTFRLKVRLNIQAKSEETRIQVTIRTACHCGRIGQVQILS